MKRGPPGGSRLSKPERAGGPVSQLYVVTSAESGSATPGCDCLAHRFGKADVMPDLRKLAHQIRKRNRSQGSRADMAHVAGAEEEFGEPAFEGGGYGPQPGTSPAV